MMTRLYSSTVLGVDGVEVEVEVDFRPMAEKRTFIVGLPDAAVKESGQRVDTAIQNSGLPFQQGIFVVNLAPADLRKQGPGFDLPIALGMVAGAAEKEMDASAWCIVGELALDGTVRPVQGILPQIMEARRMGRKRIMLPQANAYEGTPVQGVEIYPVSSLEKPGICLLPTPCRLHLQVQGERPMLHGTKTPLWILTKSKGSLMHAAPWRLQRQEAIISCFAALRGPANPCWRKGSRPFFRL